MKCEIEYVNSFVQFQINEKQMQKNEDQNESKSKFHLKNR